MFLIERLIGVGVYTLVLLFALLLILQTNKKISKILLFYLVMLSLMAFFYKPYKSADLYRIFEMVQFYGKQDGKVFLETFVKGSLSPSADLLYWVFGKLHIEFLLPVFSCVICYSIIFNVIADCSERFCLTRNNTALLLFFVMSSGLYIPVISGIRMMTSLCLLLFCFYWEYINQKITLTHIILYLLAVTVHAMAIAVLVLALFCLVFSRAVTLRYKILLLSAFVIVSLLVNRYYDLSQLLEDKANFYFYEETYFDIWEFGIGLIAIIFEISLLHYVRKGAVRLRFFELMVMFCLIIAVSFITKFSVFHRFSIETASLMLLPIVAIAVSQNPNSSRKSSFRQEIVIWSSLLYLANAARGSLSSLKFFELP
ncbi:MAG: hypothetical protein IJS17_00645 [Clostridia bacterium]|nr:hypothetical protein [Clostridia bacterium]